MVLFDLFLRFFGFHLVNFIIVGVLVSLIVGVFSLGSQFSYVIVDYLAVLKLLHCDVVISSLFQPEPIVTVIESPGQQLVPIILVDNSHMVRSTTHLSNLDSCLLVLGVKILDGVAL